MPPDITIDDDRRALRDFERALDPSSLFRALGMTPDSWQEELLADTGIDRGIVCCCRQSGKSTASACIALHQALYTAGSLVLLVSPSQRQSAELFKKCVGFHRMLPDGEAEIITGESVLRCEFSNGSRIVSLPGNEATVRGYSSPSLIIIDEASRVPDELFAAVMPMLAVSHGRLLMLSTPWGKRGAFFKSWSEGGDRWRRFFLPAAECSRISPEFLIEQRRELGEFLFQQEFLCEFLDPTSSAFSSILIEQALSTEAKPLWS